MSEEIVNEETDEFIVEPAGPKTALVSIVGRPSAGKSTFLNTATQETVSIVSAVPQTTRNAIRGIVNTSIGQLVFIDTPGLHLSEKKFNLKLTAIAEENIKDSDEILYILDSTRDHTDEEEMIANITEMLDEAYGEDEQYNPLVAGILYRMVKDDVIEEIYIRDENSKEWEEERKEVR